MNSMNRYLVLGATLVLGAAAMSPAMAQRAGAPAQPWSVRLAESVMRRDSVVHPQWDYVAGVVLLSRRRQTSLSPSPGCCGHPARPL